MVLRDVLMERNSGFIIFAIILGGTAGYFIFGRDTVVGGASVGENGAACC